MPIQSDRETWLVDVAATFPPLPRRVQVLPPGPMEVHRASPEQHTPLSLLSRLTSGRPLVRVQH